MPAAAARLATRTLKGLRESRASCRVGGEARVYSDPLRPLDVLRAYASRDGGEEAGVCVEFVLDAGKLCEPIRGVVEGRGGSEAASSLMGS